MQVLKDKIAIVVEAITLVLSSCSAAILRQEPEASSLCILHAWTSPTSVLRCTCVWGHTFNAERQIHESLILLLHGCFFDDKNIHK